MKKRNRIFLDIAIPVVLYSFIILIVQLGVGMVFGIVYYAAHAGTAADAAAAGLEQFITDRSMLISLIGNLLIIGVVILDTRIRRVKLLDYTLFAKPVGARNIVMAIITGLSFSVWLSLMLTMLPIPESLMSE